ncbi:MAG: molybdopterin cofactor-binding domain-containing protein, partial [Pseudomonadota bacterium]|nr:molybdopterin cofactor-binding domain-containing protein [Pseudomonadota bacterium]
MKHEPVNQEARPFALTRRDLLKAGGALVVAFNFMPAPLRAQAPRPPGPDLQEVDSWIAIHSDNTATIFIGFAELGQGASTALLQVAAEELDLGMDQVRTATLETDVTPNQGGTYSSRAIRFGQPQLQRAAAEARQRLLALASARLQIPVANLRVENGLITAGGDDSSVRGGCPVSITSPSAWTAPNRVKKTAARRTANGRFSPSL